MINKARALLRLCCAAVLASLAFTSSTQQAHAQTAVDGAAAGSVVDSTGAHFPVLWFLFTTWRPARTFERS